jgi:hypothetical protein
MPPSLSAALLFFILCVSVRQLSVFPRHPVPPPSAAPALDSSATTPAPPPIDIVLVVTNPWKWSGRRFNVFRAFKATQARTRFTAKMIYVMGADRAPADLAASDAQIAADPDVTIFNSPHCADLDGIWPSAIDGGAFPPANSSTTCKVLEGVAEALARFRFRYLARIGDDSYLRWDYLLERVLPPLPEAGLLLARFNANQGVFSHLQTVFGQGKFLPYPFGQGYVMTADIAAYLRTGYRASPGLITAGPEDAAVGLHLAPLSMLNYHSDEFHDPYHQACSERSVLVHYMSKAMWASIDEEGVVYCSNWPKRGRAPNWWVGKDGTRHEVEDDDNSREEFIDRRAQPPPSLSPRP